VLINALEEKILHFKEKALKKITSCEYSNQMNKTVIKIGFTDDRKV